MALETTTIQETKENNPTSFSFPAKIIQILQGNGEYNEQSLNYLEKIFKKIIGDGIKKNVGEYNFLKKFIEKNGKGKQILSGEFEKKFNKYFPIHKNFILDKLLSELRNNQEIISLIKELGKLEELNLLTNKNNNEHIDKANIEKYNALKRKIKSKFFNFINKYIQIIFTFGEKTKISNLNSLLEVKLEGVQSNYFNKHDNNIAKLEELRKKHSLGIDPLKIYKTILTKTTFDEKNNSNIPEEINKHFINQTKKLYNIFYNWKKKPFLKEDELRKIANTTTDFFNLVLVFKEAGIAFSDNFSIQKIINQGQKKDFLKEFINNFFETINSDNKIEEHNKKLFKDFLEITINSKGDYSELIDKIKEYKKKKYDNEIPEKKDDILEKEAKKIKEELLNNNLVYSEWNKIDLKQKDKIFFSSIFSKDKDKDKKVNLNFESVFLSNIKEDDLGLFCEVHNFKKEEEKIAIRNQLNNIKKTIGNFNSLKEFIEYDVNNLQLIIAWFKFHLIIKEAPGIEKEEIKKLLDEKQGINNFIADDLHENISRWKIEFLAGNDRLINDSRANIEAEVHSLKISSEKGDIDLNHCIKDLDGDKILLKNQSNLYIKESHKETKKFLETGLSVINDLLAKKNIYSEEYLNNKKELSKECENEKLDELNKKEGYYLEHIRNFKKLNIIPKEYFNLEIKTYDNLQEIEEFFKYALYKVDALNDMIKIGNESREELKKYLPEGNEFSEESGIGPEKDFYRAFEKLMKDYNGDYAQQGDLTRARVVNIGIMNTRKDVVKFVANLNNSNKFTQVSIIDSTGNPLEKPKKKSGYRDIKLLVKFKNGNVAEVQFFYKDMYDVKENGIDFTKEENEFIFKKFKEETEGLTEEELNKILEIQDIKLPKKEILGKLSNNIEINSENQNLKLEKISTQDLYNIARKFEKYEDGTTEYSINKKISRLERILADIAWGKIVTRYLENQEIDLS